MKKRNDRRTAHRARDRPGGTARTATLLFTGITIRHSVAHACNTAPQSAGWYANYRTRANKRTVPYYNTTTTTTHLLSCVLMSSLVCSTSILLALGKVLTRKVDSNCSMGVVDRKNVVST
jgi:hypothetical protein